MVIESYAAVFEQERRLYSWEVDPTTGKRWHVPSANGIPLRGVAYYGVAWIAVFWIVVAPAVAVLLAVPPLGDLFGLFPFVLQAALVLGVVFGLPGALAYAAMVAKVDGRPAHLWLLAYASWRLRPKRTVHGQRVRAAGDPYPLPRRLRVRWDLSAPRLQRLRVRGPARVEFAVPVRFSLISGGWRAKGSDRGACGHRDVPAGEVLEVRP